MSEIPLEEIKARAGSCRRWRMAGLIHTFAAAAFASATTALIIYQQSPWWIAFTGVFTLMAVIQGRAVGDAAWHAGSAHSIAHLFLLIGKTMTIDFDEETS